MLQILRDKTAPLDTSRIKGYLLGAFRGLAFCHANWVCCDKSGTQARLGGGGRPFTPRRVNRCCTAT